MLTIVDLHQEQELSASSMREVIGGMFDAYLSLDGIKGESQEDQHKDWIEIL